MRQPELPMQGGCRCERVRIEVNAPPLLTMACHCLGCQKMSASAYSLSAAIPSDGFRVVRGETVIGGLHGATRHHFCAYCMSWMFTEPEGVDFLVNLRATMLDDARWFVPFLETCTGEGLPWAKTGATHSYASLPAMEDYERLVGQYAEEVGRTDP